MLLVKQTGDDGRGRRDVQHRDDADADHEAVEFVRARRNGRRLTTNNAPDAKRRDEARQQEARPGEQVGAQRSQHESAQVCHVLVADVADAGHGVAVDSRDGERRDRLDGGNEPGDQVEVLAVGSDRLLAPLESGGEEPGEGEDDPPETGRHTEEVDE